MSYFVKVLEDLWMFKGGLFDGVRKRWEKGSQDVLD